MSTSAFTPEAMRARFAELQARKEEIQPQLDAALQKRDGIHKSASEAIEKANREYRDLEASLDVFGLQQEMAIIVRALGGQGRPARTGDLTEEVKNPEEQNTEE